MPIQRAKELSDLFLASKTVQKDKHQLEHLVGVCECLTLVL
jgi:hypothetical protein